MNHEAVGDVFSVPINSTSETIGWLGYLEGRSWGLFVDDYLLLMFGGLPWQVLAAEIL